jgi:hypothetical protein
VQPAQDRQFMDLNEVGQRPLLHALKDISFKA